MVKTHAYWQEVLRQMQVRADTLEEENYHSESGFVRDLRREIEGQLKNQNTLRQLHVDVTPFIVQRFTDG